MHGCERTRFASFRRAMRLFAVTKSGMLAPEWSPSPARSSSPPGRALFWQGRLQPGSMSARRMPVLAGGAAVLLALPVFLAAGWRVSGWVLGAVLWAVGQVLGVL